MRTKSIILLSTPLFITLLLSACRTPKQNLNYFSADTRDSSHARIWESYEAKIQPGDKLAIVVTALNTESAKPYNFASGSPVGGGVPGTIVSPQGTILFPQLGFIKAAGLTKNELRDTLLNRLRTYLTDPVVTVEFADAKITVLGEVGRQGPIPMNDRRITILEALGQAGDIATTGRRDSILVIRESNGEREFGYINLLSNQAFKSKYFTLQQNDVVYVQMNQRKLKSDNEQELLRNISILTSVLAVVSTIGLLVLNLTR